MVTLTWMSMNLVGPPLFRHFLGLFFSAWGWIELVSLILCYIGLDMDRVRCG